MIDSVTRKGLRDCLCAADTPEDYAATIYEKLGIDRDQPLYTAANRPVHFGHLGEPIREMF
ncbi:MAG: hypothetical protein U0992_14400 [Planctomycetaceae bacterium]